MRLYTFTVAGSGAFPTDMLRYDRCWPSTTEDAISIVMSARDPEYRERRLVTLTGVSLPTIGRWDSFMWYVQGNAQVRQ